MIKAEPVIVVHLDTAPGAGLTACTGEEFRPDSSDYYKTTPRVLCSGCQRAAMNGHSYSMPPGTTIIITNEQVVINHRRSQ